jgi:hypothetical protein
MDCGFDQLRFFLSFAQTDNVPINKLEHALQYTKEASSTFNVELRLGRVGGRVDDLTKLFDEFVQNEHIHDSKHD